MIERLYVCRSAGTDPYENLALEQTLLERVGEGECILYLWQNARTVVIGRNQNPWKECRTTLLAEEGGHLARRLSGGGAVFHDLGNLNFTFLMREADYDLSRQLSVIETACRSLGIPAERSGRNDLLADGRKFSGNAFYKHNGAAYHHGTLMVDVDLEMVQRYLSPSKAKLAAKGVDSVRSRVVNLREFVPDLTIPRLADALIAALAEVYAVAAHSVRHIEATGNRQQATGDGGREASGNRQQATGDGGREAAGNRHQASGEKGSGIKDQGSGIKDQGSGIKDQGSGWMQGVGAVIGRPPTSENLPVLSLRDQRAHRSWRSVLPLDADGFDLTELTRHYASDAWLYGPKMPFTVSVEDRFPWGGIELQLDVNEGVIRQAKVYTDAMDETLAPRLEAALTGVPLRLEAISAALPDAAHDELLALLRNAL